MLQAPFGRPLCADTVLMAPLAVCGTRSGEPGKGRPRPEDDFVPSARGFSNVEVV